MPTNKPAPATEPKKSEAPAKATDPKTTPAAAPKKTEAPAKATDLKTTPAAEPKKPEVPAKATDPKTTPATAPKRPEVPAKATDLKASPAIGSKKPEVPAKAADLKATPAAEPKKPETPAKATDFKTAPAAEPKKPEAPAKAADLKAAPASAPKKPETPAKATDFKTAPAIEPKKSEAPAKATDPKTTPAAASKKPEAPAKAADLKAAPAAEPKKPEAPAKAADLKTAPATEPKKPEAPAKDTDSKIAPAAEPKTAAVPSKTADGPKGVAVTQVFADRLSYPSKEDLASLPIPKEGEGFSMRLHPAYFFQFLDHPFSINREVKDYRDLFESIKENGINEPIKARPREGGGLELLSGHRRHDVAMQLNYPVPVVIVQADDDTARIEVVDGNLHRQDIPTSELARAAKMKMEALARKAGRRSKMEQLTAPQKRTDQQVAEDMGMSRNQVNRLVRIDSLVPELKQQVDDKKLPFNTAVELSYMKPEEQSRVVDFMAREQVVPSMAQATALKEASRQAAKTPAPTQAAKPKVDERQIASIVKPKKEPELRVTFTGPELADYFPKAAPTVAEVKRTVFEALDLRKKALERQAKKQEIKDAAKKPAQQGDSR